jgi:hypothetical protein
MYWSNPVNPRGATDTDDHQQPRGTYGRPNLIDVTSDREISRVIHYLDPDFHAPKASSCQHPDREALIMLILLLGGVIACFVALYIRMAE